MKKSNIEIPPKERVSFTTKSGGSITPKPISRLPANPKQLRESKFERKLRGILEHPLSKRVSGVIKQKLKKLELELGEPAKKSESTVKTKRGSRSTRIAPIPKVNFTSALAYLRTKRIWGYLFYSLPLDLIIVSFLPSRPERVQIQISNLSILFLSIALLSANLDFTWRIRTLLFELRRSIAKRSAGLVGVAVIGVLAIATIGDLIFHMALLESLWVIPLAIIAIFGAAQHQWKEQKRSRAEIKRIEEDKILWLEQANYHIFALSCLPLVSLRLAAFLFSLSADNFSTALASTLLCALILVVVIPRTPHFMIRCRSCAVWTSRALKEEGDCPVCAREKFLRNL